MVWGVPGGPPVRAGRPSLGRRILHVRIWIYVAAILVLLVMRMSPGFRSRFHRASLQTSSSRVLTLAGMDLAPVLIPRLVAEYRNLYPNLDLRLHSGGTRQALQELANRQADLAFLNRLPTQGRAGGDFGRGRYGRDLSHRARRNRSPLRHAGRARLSDRCGSEVVVAAAGDSRPAGPRPLLRSRSQSRALDLPDHVPRPARSRLRRGRLARR